MPTSEIVEIRESDKTQLVFKPAHDQEPAGIIFERTKRVDQNLKLIYDVGAEHLLHLIGEHQPEVIYSRQENEKAGAIVAVTNALGRLRQYELNPENKLRHPKIPYSVVLARWIFWGDSADKIAADYAREENIGREHVAGRKRTIKPATVQRILDTSFELFRTANGGPEYEQMLDAIGLKDQMREPEHAFRHLHDPFRGYNAETVTVSRPNWVASVVLTS